MEEVFFLCLKKAFCGAVWIWLHKHTASSKKINGGGWLCA